MTKTTSGLGSQSSELERGVHPAPLRHVDVEEEDVVVDPGGEGERLAHGRRLADDLDLFRVDGEQEPQLRPRRSLVVDDQREERRHRLSGGSTGTRIETRVPT